MPKYFSRAFFYVIIGTLLFPGLAFAQKSLMQQSESQDAEPIFLTVYTEESYPLNYTDSEAENYPIAGYATELIRAILDHAAIDFKIEMVPWGRAIQAIDNRENVVVYSMTRSIERENKYLWIGQILPLDYYLYGLKSNLEMLPKTLEDAKALNVGIVRGDVTGDYLIANGFNGLTYVSEPSSNLQMLKRGRIDLFPFNSQGVGPMIEKNDFDPAEFVGVVRLDTISTGLYFALSSQTNPVVFQRLQASYNAIVDGGEYDRIFLPFLNQDPKLEVMTIDSQR